MPRACSREMVGMRKGGGGCPIGIREHILSCRPLIKTVIEQYLVNDGPFFFFFPM
jgi:hypothetical protein